MTRSRTRSRTGSHAGSRTGSRHAAVLAAGAVAAALVLGGCGSPTGADRTGTPAPGAGALTTSGSSGTAAGSGGSGDSAAPAPPARVARTAASARIRFRPEQVVLPGGTSAPVDPAATVDRVLAVPEDIRRVGWWDGSAWAGDPFGSTVVAGHLDAPGQGLGFFERLTALRRGDVVTLGGAGHRAAYRVTTVRSVPKSSIDAGSAIFDQRSEHRLVLMTCAGHFDRATRSYDENLVVTALPVGPAR